MVEQENIEVTSINLQVSEGGRGEGFNVGAKT